MIQHYLDGTSVSEEYRIAARKFWGLMEETVRGDYRIHRGGTAQLLHQAELLAAAKDYQEQGAYTYMRPDALICWAFGNGYSGFVSDLWLKAHDKKVLSGRKVPKMRPGQLEDAMEWADSKRQVQETREKVTPDRGSSYRER